MKTISRWLALPVLVLGAVLGSAIAADAVAEHPDQYTGNMVNTMGGVRFNQPFVLSIDHYADDADVQRLTGVLAQRGQFSLRDELWHQSAGYLSIGGRIGYPVAAVLTQDDASGRILRVVVNRPMSEREVQYYRRSSMYPFTVLELHMDKNGKGEGSFLGATMLKLHGDTLEFKSLGVQPVRLLDVRQD